MDCEISREQLWSWIDRDDPELEQHLATCPHCRSRAQEIRANIGLISSDLAALNIPLPERIGPYKVSRLLGEGGQALVYEAEQPSPHRLVALKVLKGGRFAGRAHLKHFRRETQTLAALNHPAIATIYEAGVTEDGHHYFAMELVPGRSLDEAARDPEFSPAARLALFREICEAVDYAHRHGVIHRDLKPSNILVTTDGRPKVLDFGLARITEPGLDLGTRLTETGGVQGTPRYMSPEQARGLTGDIDGRTDVYSLGVILYELLTGEPPYETDRGFSPETLDTICHRAPRRPSLLDRSLKGDLETIILTCLEKDPERRYGSAAALLEDLRRFERNDPILAKPAGPGRRVRRMVSRHPALAAGTLTALLMLLVAVWWFQRPPYDLERARDEVLTARCLLFEDEPSLSAITEAIDLPRRYPGLLEASLAKAHSLSISDKVLALHFMEGELKRDPSLWPYRALLRDIGLEPRDGDSATVIVWPPPGVSPSDAEAWYARTFATLDRDSALAWSRTAVSLDPDHLLALESATLLSETVGDLEAALAGATALARAGRFPERWMNMRSALLIRLGRYDEALAELDLVIARRPDNYGGYRVRAPLNRHLGRYEDAVRDYSRAIELNPNLRITSSWLIYHRSTPLWILGRNEEAAADLREVYRRLTYPTFGNARLYLVLRDLGRPDEARKALDEARRNTVNDPWLATILDAMAGRMTPEALVAAAGENPTRLCEATYYAGEICRLEGRDAEADRWFRRCVDQGPVPNPGDDLNPMSELELARWRLGLPGVAEMAKAEHQPDPGAR